jgi:predicted ATPase/DNA-binding SARP family transcriptional activator
MRCRMTTKRLHLRLLGPVQLDLDGAPLNELVSTKARALLYYLAVTRQVHPRGKLAGLLWSDLPEADARRNLRVALNALNRVLPAYVHVIQDRLAFDVTQPYWLDVEEFEKLLGDGVQQTTKRETVHRLRSAVELYRGDLVQDLQLSAAPLFEEWVLVERERLRQHALDALRRLTDAYLARGELEPGILIAQRALALDPWREEFHRALMLLLALNGQRTDALKQYQVCLQMLAQEFHADVSAETTALYEQIRAGTLGAIKTPASAETEKRSLSPLPNNLAAPTTPFVGRSEELAQLAELLAGHECRLLTLTGAGGIGKTRLALQLAQQFVTTADPLFSDGVYFLSLAEISSHELLVPTLAELLGLTLTASNAPVRELCNALRAKSLLLVLDNFEHLAASAGVLVEILRAAGGIKILVTSREALNLYEEWLFAVEGLAVPLDESEELENYSAVQLFVQRARRAHLGFALQAEKKSVVQICQLVEGMPLGIELAAARVRTLGCEAIANEIRDNLDALSLTYRNIPTRHQTLRAVFEYSWNLLGESEQLLLSKLAVFRGGFDTSAAIAVTDIPLRELSSLVDKSLVRRGPGGRFSLHETIRQYAQEKLSAQASEQSLRTATELKHSVWYAAALAQQTPTLIAGNKQAVALGALKPESDNFHAAWYTAADSGRLDILAQMAKGLLWYCELRGWFVEGEKMFAHASARIPPDSLLFARVLAYRGHLCQRTGRLVEAQQLLEHAVKLFRECQDPELTFALLVLGNLPTDSGQRRVLYQEALELYRAQEDEWGIGAALNNLGELALAEEDFSNARRYVTEALQLCRALGDRSGEAHALANLGDIAFDLQDYATAARDYMAGLQLAQELDFQYVVAWTTLGLGNVARMQGNFDDAERWLMQSLALRRRMNNRAGEAKVLHSLGELALARGDESQALEFFETARAIATEKQLLAL